MTGGEGTIPSLFCCHDRGVCLQSCVFGVVLYMPHVTHFTLGIFKTTDNVENMAENILTFTNTEFGTIRLVDIDGQPWFVGRDVASVLGYSSPSVAVRKS